VIIKNKSLTKPLTDKEIEAIFKKSYKYECSSIEEKLPFINCDNCKFKFKGGKLKAGNILVRNLSKIKHISNTERGRDRNMARPALDEEFPIHTLSIV